MAKRSLFILVTALVASSSFGQTAKPKLDAARNDPQTTQNAAKADVRVINNKNVADSAVLKTLLIKRKEVRSKRKKNLQRRTS